MASRILHPSRPSRTSDQKSTEKPSRLSKRLSVSAAPVAPSKIPLQSSSQSRSSNNTSKKLDIAKPGTQRVEAESQNPTRQEQDNSAVRKGGSQLASGIPRSLGFSMGGRTAVSAKQPPSRNRLRRKQSAQDQRLEHSSSEPPQGSYDIVPASKSTPETSTNPKQEADIGSVLGMSPPTLSSSTPKGASLPQRPPELAHLDAYVDPSNPSLPTLVTSTPDLKPPTLGFVRSNSASTRCSESPSPWSRTSTPTSVSSHSPGLSSIPKFATRVRQVSPTRSRPPVTRRKLTGSGPRDDEDALGNKGLHAVRESMTSSSSSSPMRTTEPVVETDRVAKRKSLIPPTPPLRISSKSKQARPELAGALSQQDARPPTLPPMRSSDTSNLPPETRLPALNTTRSRIPPPRPSREGTPILEHAKPSPVIQSNLTHLATTGHKRRESAEKALLASPSKSGGDDRPKPALSRAPSITSNTSTSGPQVPNATSQAKVTSPHLWSRESSRSREAASARSIPGQQTRRDPSPMFTSPGKSISRFGLFSRKTKSPAEPTNSASVEKPVRKGPAAGTGHEGYGRYARRGRSGSTSTAASRGRSTSTDRTSFSATGPASSRKSSFTSSDGKPELDDFLKDRLEPVFIGGGGKIRDTRNGGLGLYRMQSNQSSSTSISSIAAPVQAPLPPVSYPPSSNASSDDVATDFTSFPHYQTTLGTTAEARPTLAHRRSLHRLQLFGEAPPVRIPSPINTRILADSPALETYDSTLSSLPLTDASVPLTDDYSEGHEGNWLNPKKKAQAKSKVRRWNIFHRTQRSSERVPDGPLDSSDSWRGFPGEVSAFGDSRPIAHYAMVDGFESEAPENLEDALRNIEQNLEFDYEEEPFVLPEIPSQAREPSILLPSPPKFPSHFEPFPRPVSPAKVAPPPSEAQQNPAVRMSPEKLPRLQHVGRIPRVVSKRERSFRPSPQSFSRPFAPRSNSDQNIENAASLRSPAAERPTIGVRTDKLPRADFPSELLQSGITPPTNGMLYNLGDEREFLRFSRRQDSEISGSSDSGILSMVPITAALPTSDAILSDDEVWGEYDDFIDHVASPSSISPDTPGLPKFPDAYFNSNGAIGLGTPKIDVDSDPLHEGSLREAAEAAAQQTYKPVLPPRPSYLNAPAEQNQLSSPMSLSDLYAGYGSRSSASKSVNRNSIASTMSGSRYSSQTIISESASPTCNEDAHAKRVTQVLAEKTYNASSDSLRFSALMTSRWLSFDRVLFSPVQAELRNSRQDRILVVDGLENDDWSTYCALTYPDTNVYNLCSASALWSRKASEISNSEKWMPPTNHRRISYNSISAPFPFPKGFFTAVVLRFPTANTDYAYRNAMAECKRVLRPGGFLELTILDMDMVNMGNHVSRAIRNLKVRMQAALPDVSLSPASDEIIKLLGRKGFENISRCVVGVPVTGALSDSRKGSMNEPPSPDREAETGAQLSLGALLAGQAQGADLYYPVTKMVARVARWWWSKCYETSILGEPRESMWSHKDLLRECEERETGLKMVICYAQKPTSARRRTVSV